MRNDDSQRVIAIDARRPAPAKAARVTAGASATTVCCAAGTASFQAQRPLELAEAIAQRGGASFAELLGSAKAVRDPDSEHTSNQGKG